MAKRRYFSGTPVAEGVRLEVGKYTVFAVRKADKDIAVRMRREPRKFLRVCMRMPFLRGAVRLVRDVVRFFDGLAESVELRPQRVVRGTKPERGLARMLHVHPQSIVTFTSLMLIPILAFLCLWAAPEGAELLMQNFSLTRAWVNGISCAVRVLGLLLYITLCCRLRVLRRLQMLRGAINMVINCYESRDEMTPERAALYSRHTYRSEPAFVVSVVVISMILFSLLRVDALWVSLLLRILILLGVAAVLNEPFSALEAADDSWATRILRAPIELIQHMTTLEPHPQMVEVAVCAFQAALGELGQTRPSAAEEENET